MHTHWDTSAQEHKDKHTIMQMYTHKETDENTDSTTYSKKHKVLHTYRYIEQGNAVRKRNIPTNTEWQKQKNTIKYSTHESLK